MKQNCKKMKIYHNTSNYPAFHFVQTFVVLIYRHICAFICIQVQWMNKCFKARFCIVRLYWAGDNLGEWGIQVQDNDDANMHASVWLHMGCYCIWSGMFLLGCVQRIGKDKVHGLQGNPAVKWSALVIHQRLHYKGNVCMQQTAINNI